MDKVAAVATMEVMIGLKQEKGQTWVGKVLPPLHLVWVDNLISQAGGHVGREGAGEGTRTTACFLARPTPPPPAPHSPCTSDAYHSQQFRLKMGRALSGVCGLWDHPHFFIAVRRCQSRWDLRRQLPSGTFWTLCINKWFYCFPLLDYRSDRCPL